MTDADDGATGGQAATEGVAPDSAVTADTGQVSPAAPDSPAPESKAESTLLAQLGGPMGMVDSGLPVLVFILVNVMAGLTPAIIAAVTAGVVIAALRLIRRKPASQAIGGLFAVGVAAYIAHRMGTARGYFAFGIWTQALYGGAFLLSIIVRWPLIGVLWEGLNSRGRAWRADRRLRHRYDAATLVWVAVFGLRYGVQQWLYDKGDDLVGWLAAARLAMGYPLFILAILATIVIVGSATGVSLKALWRKRAAARAAAAAAPNADRHSAGGDQG